MNKADLRKWAMNPDQLFTLLYRTGGRDAVNTKIQDLQEMAEKLSRNHENIGDFNTACLVISALQQSLKHPALRIADLLLSYQANNELALLDLAFLQYKDKTPDCRLEWAIDWGEKQLTFRLDFPATDNSDSEAWRPIRDILIASKLSYEGTIEQNCYSGVAYEQSID